MSLYIIADHPIINKCALAAQFIPKGTDVLYFGDNEGDDIRSTPNMHSVQLGQNSHLDSFTEARFAAHSSAPNCRLIAFVKKDGMNVEFNDGDDVDSVCGYSIRTLIDLEANEQITWDYNSSEEVVTCSFEDLHTKTSICGFFSLTEVQQRSLLPLATPFIHKRYAEIMDSRVCTTELPIVGQVLTAKKDLLAGTIIASYGDNEGDFFESAPSMHSVQLSDTRHVTTLTLGRYASHLSNANCILVPFTRLANSTLTKFYTANSLGSISIGSTTTSGESNDVTTPCATIGGCGALEDENDKVDGFWLTLTRDAKAGDALGFNYNTSEWDMACGFDDIDTGIPIRGFKHLPKHLQEKMIFDTTPFVYKNYMHAMKHQSTTTDSTSCTSSAIATEVA